MKETLIIVGSSSHVLSEFRPFYKYEKYILCDRYAQQKDWVNSRMINLHYDLNDSWSNNNLIEALEEDEENINIIFSSYRGDMFEDMDAKQQLDSLNANCRMPLELFSMISKKYSESIVNGIFISSMYAGIAPNYNNYKEKSMQNPFLYGVSKAGVEQGLRWLSCQNKNHRFNSIRLGAMPKDEVKYKDPNLIKNLLKNMPSGQCVGKNELNLTINYMLDPNLFSLRGTTITLDGGYSIW